MFGEILAALLVSRLCHLRILWADGDYHLAAAVQMLQGSALYRDFWFDKPPLTPLLYLAFGARPGAVLMLSSAMYLFAACLLAYFIARRLWGEREGLAAAALLAWSLIFYLPAAVVPLVPDLAMILPHLAAIACLAGGFPVAAGVAAGIALFFNVKGVFVLAVCLMWLPKSWLKVTAGFGAVAAAGALILIATGTWNGYWEQVWKWSLAYAGSTPIAEPYLNALRRTANWLGFHSALAASTVVFFLRERSPLRRRAAIWIVVSALGVCLGLRFLPRYFFQVLPALAIFGARGLMLAFGMRPKIVVLLAGLLLLVPVVRFGPRYMILASDLIANREHRWGDLALDQDNQAVALIVEQRARAGDTLFVWGYRPGIFVYTRLDAGSRFLDSQPLTGVPADRHFTTSKPIKPDWARANREELASSSPTFVVDSLSRANARLAMDRFPELRDWFQHYRVVGETALSVIYERTELPDATGVLARHRLPRLAPEGLLKFGHVRDDAVHPVLPR